MKKSTEAGLQKSILEYLRGKGFYAQRINCGLTRLQDPRGRVRVIRGATKGTPDVLACLYGYFVGIEVKNGPEEVEKFHKKIANIKFKGILPSYKREADQSYQHSKIRSANGIAWVVGSLKQLKELISNEFDNEKK